VHPARLATTIGRLLASGPAADAAASPDPAALPEQDQARLEPDDHLFLTEGRVARFARVRSIVCIRGANDYSEIVLADGKQLLLRRPLKEWEARLPPSFARVHRSSIVNLDHVERVERDGDEYRVHLRGTPEPVALSRRHAQRLRGVFGV